MITIVRWIDRVCRPLVWISIGMYIWELSYHTMNSYESPMWFLWSERIIASIFMIEYLMRFIEDKLFPDNTPDYCVHGKGSYATSLIGIVDLLAWLPFVVGFFVPVQYLGFIRTLRVLRLLKFFRYSRRLQLVLLGFYRAWDFLRTLAFMIMVTCLFSSVVLYELEPETFNNKITDAIWYAVVTASTVGYGDISPVTDLGKVIALLLLFVPAGAVYAGMIGVMGGMFTVVLEEEKNPDIDPIRQFHKARRTRRELGNG